MLALAVGQSFERIAETVDVIRQPGASVSLTVSATLAFSHFWLLPRLSSLLADHPEIKLRVLSQDLPVDLRDGTVDVALRYGKPPYRDGDVAASMSDEIFPVCSPGMLARLGPDRLAAWPADLPRIDSEAPDASWLTWRRWFAARRARAGSPDAGALRFSHYNDAVYAAIDGQGVVLGWTHSAPAPADGRAARSAREPQRDARRGVLRRRPRTEPVSASCRHVRPLDSRPDGSLKIGFWTPRGIWSCAFLPFSGLSPCIPLRHSPATARDEFQFNSRAAASAAVRMRKQQRLIKC